MFCLNAFVPILLPCLNMGRLDLRVPSLYNQQLLIYNATNTSVDLEIPQGSNSVRTIQISSAQSTKLVIIAKGCFIETIVEPISLSLPSPTLPGGFPCSFSTTYPDRSFSD